VDCAAAVAAACNNLRHFRVADVSQCNNVPSVRVNCRRLGEISAVCRRRLPGTVTSAAPVRPADGDNRLSPGDQQWPPAAQLRQRRRKARLLLRGAGRRTCSLDVRHLSSPDTISDRRQQFANISNYLRQERSVLCLLLSVKKTQKVDEF